MVAAYLFVKNMLIPILEDLARKTLELLKRKIDLIKRAWYAVLSAMKEIWSWVVDVFIPFIEEQFAAALEKLRELIDAVKDAFERVKAAIQSVIEKLEALIRKAKEAAEAMNPFTGGSPSPLELGLRGAARAMRELSAVEVPRLTASMQMAPAPVYAGGGISPVGATTNNVTVPITANIYNGMDVAEFQIRVENAVTRAINRRW
jgi:hypothetical protein